MNIELNVTKPEFKNITIKLTMREAYILEKIIGFTPIPTIKEYMTNGFQDGGMPTSILGNLTQKDVNYLVDLCDALSTKLLHLKQLGFK